MKKSLLLFILSLFAATMATASTTSTAPTPTSTSGGEFLTDVAPGPRYAALEEGQSFAFRVLNYIMEASAREIERFGLPRPTVTSRAHAIACTAMYDAWACYDDTAIGTRLGGTLRRPPEERTLENKKQAIAHAAFRIMADIYPEDIDWVTSEAVTLGVNPENKTRNPASPVGIANLVADAILEFRHRDGANQHGDMEGGCGQPYGDYTGYEPVNPVDKINDPDRWQPIEFVHHADPEKHVTPGFLTPHWDRIQSFGLTDNSQFRLPPPPLYGSEQLRKEVDEVIQVGANLTPEQKAVVEFMRDGPGSTGQSGHWLRFAQDVSVRDGHDLDTDIKIFFVSANTSFDAFIACWDSKRKYDSSRPWTLVRHYYQGREVPTWAGPGKGVITAPAEQWLPYSPPTFITPPFPGYPSGHAAVSGAGARILEHFTGSDEFNGVEKRVAGALTEPGIACELMQAIEGQPSERFTGPEACRIALQLPTFSAIAEMAAVSRLWGGYHIRADNEMGLKQGRQVADYLWPVFQSYFDGTATIRE